MNQPSPTQPICQKTASRNLAHIALVLFLAILLIQSALGLFLPQRADMDSVDIVLRTAISSIFGYLMSSMGQKSITSTQKSQNQNQDQNPDNNTNNNSAPRTIGFSGEGDTSSLLIRADSAGQNSNQANQISPNSQNSQISQNDQNAQKNWSADNLQFQTIIIACLGFFCLSVLIFLHYYTGEITATTGVIATIAQFRDIISGSIGALIGLARGYTPEEI